MAVFTVMGEGADGEVFKLHQEAVRDAAQALAVWERFKALGLGNIRAYRETKEIDLPALTSIAAKERAQKS